MESFHDALRYLTFVTEVKSTSHSRLNMFFWGDQSTPLRIKVSKTKTINIPERIEEPRPPNLSPEKETKSKLRRAHQISSPILPLREHRSDNITSLSIKRLLE